MTFQSDAAHVGGVLIVDDHPPVTRALSALLKRQGFECVSCHTGQDALVYSESATPAAIVLDIHLPDINGLLLAQMLRSRFGSEMPIIVVSGDNSMETIRSLQHVGATHFFSKPVNANALVERLKELVNPRQTRASA